MQLLVRQSPLPNSIRGQEIYYNEEDQFVTVCSYIIQVKILLFCDIHTTTGGNTKKKKFIHIIHSFKLNVHAIISIRSNNVVRLSLIGCLILYCCRHAQFSLSFPYISSFFSINIPHTYIHSLQEKKSFLIREIHLFINFYSSSSMFVLVF